MDEELTLWELGRLEAERKLRTIAPSVLETAWVREAQVEAVIDAVLVLSVGSNTSAYARAREVGEWSARIAGALKDAPDAVRARRIGVLRDLDPAALERIPELRNLAGPIREYQRYAIDGDDRVGTLALIVAVADEFAQRIGRDEGGLGASPSLVLELMHARSDGALRSIVAALATAVHPKSRMRVA
ncbi:MAG TPA: hypothetical protein VMW12_01625 [Candidatus Dormibacteraeota bacterium]|nr:hypothetical protein [Candidatus Dormibacteraeota bacterium]